MTIDAAVVEEGVLAPVTPVVEEGRQACLETTGGFETGASAPSSTTVETGASAPSSTTVGTGASAPVPTTVGTGASAPSSTTIETGASTPSSTTEALDLLAAAPLVALTGAGLSTDSGIPDYRGPDAPARMPMTYQEFVSGHAAQQRYWARSHIGWGRMTAAEPNAGHHALAAIDPRLLITQNVDGLHEAAWRRTGGKSGESGAPDDSRIVALHGRISDVICLSCRTVSSRAELHARMEALNPGWAAAHADVAIRPDGDVALEETDGFVVPSCKLCGGVLKPDVVFFGENVPKERVARCLEAVDALASVGGALLVAGSSLTVMSGLRFVRRAAKAGTPIVIVNRGTTRGDDLATYKVEAGTSEFLTALAVRRGAVDRA